MVNFQTELKQHVAAGGNCVNLGRTLAANHPAIYNWVMESTEFLNGPTGIKFNERVYCLVNDLSSRPVNALGEPAVFGNLFTGYSMKTRSADRKLKAQQRSAAKSQSAEKAKTALNELQQQYQYWASRVGSSDYDLGKKIYQHVSGWHTGAGKNYYTDSAQEGVDYVVCPITQLRKCSITLHYTKVLGFSTIEEYLAVAGPDTQLRANAHSQRISSALKVVDPETGMTKHQIAHTKTIATLSQKDHTGLTGYDQIGIKTRATHMANVDELGRNGYSQLASKAIVKGNSTKRAKGMITSELDQSTFRRYKTVVIFLTAKHKSTYFKDVKLGLAGVPGASHIDHMYSIFDGFRNKVSPLVIASIENLRAVPWEDNLAKQSSSTLELSELLNKCKYTLEKSRLEFDSIIGIIEQYQVGKEFSSGEILKRFYDETNTMQESNIRNTDP